MQSLPITSQLPEIRQVLAGTQSAVLAAPPGSGKTTLVPLSLLDEPWLAGKTIILLEPRRLAARAAARRMSDLCGEPCGETVGYRIRFEQRISERTRIEVVTEGVLTRRLQRDPELQGVGLVIFDEFHERSLQADLGLALCLDVQQGLRDDLRILVMSATLDTQAVSRLLGDAPVISGNGRSHPVTCHYLPRAAQGDMIDTLVKGINRVLREVPGDLLVFLPGTGEIRRTAARLESILPQATAVLPLYGDLSRSEQDRALRPQIDCRRVVLATSIAETSLTIEGITAVVDSGWSRRPSFDPNCGLSRLRTVRVSLAAADQRAGRAGRLGPGHCYRLWTAAEHSLLPPQHPPEVVEADMAPLALELALWGVTDACDLQWLDPPPAGAWAQAQALLQRLDALDDARRITPIGRRMIRLSLHPRLAYMLLRANDSAGVALDLAALLSERDILKRNQGERLSCDMEARLHGLNAWRRKGRPRNLPGIDTAACAQVERAVAQWRPVVGKIDSEEMFSVGGCLALAFPDRIAKRRAGTDGRYLLASGRGVRLAEDDPMIRYEYLVVADLDAGGREGRVFRAAPISEEEIRLIQGSHIDRRSRIEWDTASRSVLARDEEHFGALILRATPHQAPDSAATVAVMLQGIRQVGLEVLPWKPELHQWCARVLALREWQPDQGWPDLSDGGLDETLEQWLAPYLADCTRVTHLSRLDLSVILRNLLDWPQQQALERLAPSHLELPSGSRRRLQYRAGEAPILAVRLQELFGLRDTPTVCQGQIPVLLHLLSPAQRPIQVTSDLAGFWDRTYSEVRKELKGRYPKHYWPDDPTTAVPTARVRPNSR